MEPLENQLFEWEDWDGDHEMMTYYDPVLKVQIGKWPVGTKFSHATILFNKGVLQLENMGPMDGFAPPVYCAEYSLKLSINGVIKE